jgi:hypothetical protein
VAQHCEPLDVGAHVEQLDPVSFAVTERESSRHRRLDRTAPVQRTTTIANTRQHSLLERICGVGIAGEHGSSLDPHEQLQRRLAVAILQIGVREPVAMSAEYLRAPGARDQSKRLDRVEPAERPRSPKA